MLHRIAGGLVPLVPFSILLGCATYTLEQRKSPPIDAFAAAPSDAATVCVIRPAHRARRLTYVVHDGAQLVGATRGESWFCYYAEPGPHRVVSSTSDALDDQGTATLHARAGHRYWLRQDFDVFFGNQLEWIDEEHARDLVRGCDYKELVEATGDEGMVTSDDVPYARALDYAGRIGGP